MMNAISWTKALNMVFVLTISREPRGEWGDDRTPCSWIYFARHICIIIVMETLLKLVHVNKILSKRTDGKAHTLAIELKLLWFSLVENPMLSYSCSCLVGVSDARLKDCAALISE